MEFEKFNVRYNVMNISSIDAFVKIRGLFRNDCKDVFFLRGVGVGNSLCSDILKIDEEMYKAEQRGIVKYSRINCLPKLVDIVDINYYSAAFDFWIESGRKKCSVKITENNKNNIFSRILGVAIDEVCHKLFESSDLFNESAEKNFVIKIMFWIDFLGDFFADYDINVLHKIIYCGRIKKHEYLFFYLLTKLGTDVFIICCNKDLDVCEQLLNLSSKVILGSFKDVSVLPYDKEKYKKITKKTEPQNNERTIPIKIDRDNIVKKERRKDLNKAKKIEMPAGHTEMDFEELAKLASSVVMIAVHGKNGDIIGTGSGIMISSKGYILTNNHVAGGGYFYSVKIEDDNEIYSTDEFIKYNSVLDLAILRIDRKLIPIPVYNGEKKLLRGQKVVAIGSPLGLFNSVSDGIISGFRNIDGVDMIQFTAPISHGSSGGAVINMFGEVIGISTAGFDTGQNINLAVGYEFIRKFAGGFF